MPKRKRTQPDAPPAQTNANAEVTPSPDALPPKKSPQIRAWFITQFKLPYQFAWDPAEYEYVEECDDTTKDGKPHKHFVVFYKKRVTAYRVQRDFPGSNHEALRLQETTYLHPTPENRKTGYITYGKREIKQGTRTDLARVRDQLKAGWSLSYLMRTDEYGDIIARHMHYFRQVEADNDRLTIDNDLRARFQHVVLKPWQQRLLDILREPVHDRAIYWFWDHVGNTGKSFFAKYLRVVFYAFQCESADHRDVAHAYKGESIVVFDYARTSDVHKCYATLEKLKDGAIFSPKYDSQMKCFVPPHVVVFANYPPMMDKLSLDRWRIHEIVD